MIGTRNHPGSRSAKGSLLAAGLAALCFATVATSPLEAAPKRGEIVPISGTVMDAEGRPIPGITVLLEASRVRFSLRKLKNQKEAPLRRPVVVDSEGRFRFDWSWDSHHNTFELAAGFEARYGDRLDFEILLRQEITALVVAGGGEMNLVIEKADYARWLGRYLEGDVPADEARLFREQGRPDKLVVEETEPGEAAVSAWWYFADGKVYRFRDGRLDETVDFEPIKPPSSGDSP